jgi:hypothetical protein
VGLEVRICTAPLLALKVYHSPTGFDGLSHPQKLYFAVGLLEGEVYNGGFQQYFFNDSGSYYAYAEERPDRSRRIPDAPTIAGSQRDSVSWRSRPCKNRGAPTVTSFRPAGKSPTPKWSEKLDNLDKRFWADSEGIAVRFEAFARNQGLVSNVG